MTGSKQTPVCADRHGLASRSRTIILGHSALPVFHIFQPGLCWTGRERASEHKKIGTPKALSLALVRPSVRREKERWILALHACGYHLVPTQARHASIYHCELVRSMYSVQVEVRTKKKKKKRDLAQCKGPVKKPVQFLVDLLVINSAGAHSHVTHKSHAENFPGQLRAKSLVGASRPNFLQSSDLIASFLQDLNCFCNNGKGSRSQDRPHSRPQQGPCTLTPKEAATVSTRGVSLAARSVGPERASTQRPRRWTLADCCRND